MHGVRRAQTDSARISRALRQYELVLREWYLGGEWLALSHFYRAVETLTTAVMRTFRQTRSAFADRTAAVFMP